MYFEATNSVGVTGLNELIKNGVIEKIVAQTQLVKETKLIERVLQEIARPAGLCVIDEKKAKNAIEISAVETLLVTDDYLLSNRKQTEQMMEQTEKQRGQIHIVSTKNQAGKTLKGFGGIAALLRFKPPEE